MDLLEVLLRNGDKDRHLGDLARFALFQASLPQVSLYTVSR